MDETARGIARMLLERGAVSINSRQPFVYTSGITSPIYTDNRLLISYPDERERIVEALARQVVESVGADGVDVVAGTATAGIPWAAWVAWVLRKPMVYVRPNPKEHGKARQIEGVLREGQRVAVVEDLISTGTSSLQTVDAIRQAGGTVTHCFAIFTYEFQEARRAYDSLGIECVTLSNISTLLEVATAEGFIGLEDEQAVIDWLAPRRAGSL